MATKLSYKDLPIDLKYEPGLKFKFGITDETTDTKFGTLIRVKFEPKIESQFHYHTNGDLFFYCLSGKTVWYIGKEKKEYVIEEGDFLYVPRFEIHRTVNPSDTVTSEALTGYFGCTNPYKSGKVLVEETPGQSEK
jgi:quercetin dioxygenase-like cupin family protein